MRGYNCMIPEQRPSLHVVLRCTSRPIAKRLTGQKTVVS
jgi:hypothetical protein